MGKCCESLKEHICWEKLENKYAKNKKYRKVREHCHYRGE